MKVLLQHNWLNRTKLLPLCLFAALRVWCQSLQVGAKLRTYCKASENDYIYTAEFPICQGRTEGENDRLGRRRGGKASFTALYSDMAYLTCFSWSHCSRTVHEHTTVRPTRGREQWASLDIQMHTQTKAYKYLFLHWCLSKGLWTRWMFMFMFLSVWRPYVCSL